MTFQAGRGGAPRRRLRLPGVVHVGPLRRRGSHRGHVRARAAPVAPLRPDRGSVRTWLCQVARTVALDHFRSERRRVRREELAAPPRSDRLPLRRGTLPRPRVGARTADGRRARGRRAPRPARSRRGRSRAHSRHLPHQLHDAPEPGVEETRGGTPCRSVTWSRSCAPRMSKPHPKSASASG